MREANDKHRSYLDPYFGATHQRALNWKWIWQVNNAFINNYKVQRAYFKANQTMISFAAGHHQ